MNILIVEKSENEYNTIIFVEREKTKERAEKY